MTVNELKINIINNSINNLYVFYGEEHEVQKVYITKIAEISDSELEYIDSISEALSSSGSSLFSIKKCFVCLDNDIVKSSNFEKDFAKIKQSLGENCLILQFTKLDKRSKFYTYATENLDIIEFEKLNPVVINKHLLDMSTLKVGSATKLAEVCDYDYGRCLLELDKIKRYSDVKKFNCDVGFQELYNANIIYEDSESKVFDFVDSVLGCKPKQAFNLLQECKDVNEPTMKLLSVLFTGLKHLLQVQACSGDISASTGLSAWEIKNVQKFQGIYRNYELINAIRLIQNVESGIKTGKIEEQIALDYVLVNIL